MNLTQDYLWEILDYDQFTGKLFWKSRKSENWNTRYAGKEAFTAINGRGYLCGTILGKQYRKHRVIWLWQQGWSPPYIDHIDHDKTNNKMENLRAVTKLENEKNQPLRKENKSGRTGVCYDKSRNRWIASISDKSLGRFNSFEEALKVREEAEINLGYHKNHGK